MMQLKPDYTKILKLGGPILVGQLGMIVVGFADNMMVGQYSTDALASASFVNNVFNVAILMCLGFTYGLTPLIGALFAKNDDHEIGCTLRDGLRLNLIYSLAITAVMTVIYVNLDRLGQPEHLLPSIRSYYLIYLMGVVPIALFQTFAQWAYAIGSTKMPMWIILAANALNVIGNYMLIYGNFGMPEMGLDGAGIATLVSRWFCPAVIVVIFMRVKRYRRYHSGFFHGKGERSRRKRIFVTSMPVSLQLGLETGSFSVAAMMAGWLGHYELAAFQVLLVMGTIGFCVYYSFGTAISVVVANAAGAHDDKAMRRLARAGYRVILFFALIASTIFLVAGKTMVGIFTTDINVTELALSCIIPLILYQLADATQVTYSNALRGTSHVLPIFWTSLVSYVIVGIPATYAFGFIFGWGLQGIYYSFSVSLLCAAVLYRFFFMRVTRHTNQS